MTRNRIAYLCLCLCVMVLGLMSRRFSAALPVFLADNSGDALWALMVFVGIGVLFPRAATVRIAAAALAFSYLVEISQLYHAPWIDTIRATKIGGLVLGYGFLWSDLVRYAVGVFIGALLETGYRARLPRTPGSDPS